jgi:hypothetical protein
MMYQVPYIARIFVSDIVRLHGVPRRMIYDRGSFFTRLFWISFQEDLGIHLNFSMAYHHEADGNIERTNQILEDMLNMYVMDQHKHWEDLLPLVEFV